MHVHRHQLQAYGSVLQSQQQYQTVNSTIYNDNMENLTILESQPQYQTPSPTSFNNNRENTSILERALTSAINDNSQNIQLLRHYFNKSIIRMVS